ncbi:hypothetical protein PUN28_001767 [Cardiocondyla obscurior]|uniref:MADF domain-containing protein n=1 Tax=Cardiocondyla obscurior TaxID=286306 RepID=A0AAW2GR43_9HYME
MPNVWTEDDTEKLIALYGRYQCLWNPFYSEFNSKSLRYEAYKKIKSSMNISGLTICDCIKRIVYVKKEYCYELSKIAAAIYSNKLYAPKAKWFKSTHMLFFPRTNNNTDLTAKLYLCDKMVVIIDTVSSVQLQDSLISSKTFQTFDVATETNNGTAEHETQTDLLHDRSTYTDNIPMKMDEKKIQDSFDIFGKNIAFQLRTIDIETAVELEKKIQTLITKARLKILESKLIDQSNNRLFCCCDCNDCKIMCKDETCSCGLTLKECLFTKIKKVLWVLLRAICKKERGKIQSLQ